jgi:hypothetical protein
MTQVTIDDCRAALNEPGMLEVCLNRLDRVDYDTVDIYCNNRKADGWLEWGLKIKYVGPGGIYVGAIQRQKGGEYEFHS